MDVHARRARRRAPLPRSDGGVDSVFAVAGWGGDASSAFGGGGRVRPHTPRTTTGAGAATRGARAYLELEHGGGHHLDDARGRARGSK